MLQKDDDTNENKVHNTLLYQDQYFFNSSSINQEKKETNFNNNKTKIIESFENLLGSKLILSKESNMLIMKPYFIFNILNQLKYTLNINIKIEIIEKLNWIINKLHSNAFILVHKSLLKESKNEKVLSFMEVLIDILIENNRETTFINTSLKLIDSLVTYTGINSNDYFFIFSKINNLFQNEKQFDGNKLLVLLQVINKFLIKSIHDENNFPEKFFFFNNYLSELKVLSDELQNENLSITKGFTIGFWFYLEKIDIDRTNKKITDNCTLFTIQTNKFIIFEAILQKNKIYYKANIMNSETIIKEEKNKLESNNLNEYIFLSDIPYNKWNFLVFVHKPISFLQKSEIILYINNISEPIIQQYDYPNVNNQKISNISLFKNFTGLMSNVFFINEQLTNPSIINEIYNYNFGFYNEKKIRALKEYLNETKLNNENSNKSLLEFKNFINKLIFMYSPCRTSSKICKNVFGNINAEINTYSEGILIGGMVIDNSYTNNIYINEGAVIFLPIFEFIFVSEYGTPVILEEALNILINIFSRKDYYINENSKFYNYKDKNIFFFLSNIMMKYKKKVSCNLFTNEILIQFINLGKTLLMNYSETYSFLLTDYCKLILFNPKIISNFDLNLQFELFKQLEKLYEDYIEIMHKIIESLDLFEIIISLFDNNNNLYCCDFHSKMLCEINELNNKSIQIHSPNLLIKIQSLLNMLRKKLTNSDYVSIEQMSNLIPYLSMEMSPCLLKELIFLLRDIFILEITTNQYNTPLGYINSFIQNDGIEHLLYIISISTLDIRYESIKLINLILFNLRKINEFPYNIGEELIPYMCNIFFPFKINKFNKRTKNEENLNSTNLDNYYENYDDDKFMVGKNNDDLLVKSSMLEIEEEYWNLFISEDLIKLLNLPIIYVHLFSNKINDSFVEEIYHYLIKWLVNKLNKGILSNNSPTELDDDDNIQFEPALNLLMQLIMFGSLFLKQKFLADLYTLTQYNKINCNIILRNKYFYYWFLDLLLPFQILKVCKFSNKINDSRSGLCDTIISLGINVHTNIIINSILFEQEIQRDINISSSFFGYDSKSSNMKSEIVDHSLIFNNLLTWMYKIRKIGDNENKACTLLIRTFLYKLVDKLKFEIVGKFNNNERSIVWDSFLSLTLSCYEFAVIKNFEHKLIDNSSYIDSLGKNEVINDAIKNLNINIDNEQQSYEFEDDKNLLLLIYDCYKDLWSESFFAIDKSGSIFSNDNHIIEIMLNKKIFDEDSTSYCTEMSLLLFTNQKYIDNNKNKDDDINIMRIILNIIILFIRLNQSIEQINYWIKELEKYILFLFISSQRLCVYSSNSHFQITEEFLIKSQINVSNTFILAINFLQNEINIQKNMQNNDEVIENIHSCIKTLFVSFILIIEKILNYIESENSQSKAQIVWNFLVKLKDIVTMKVKPSYNYSALWKVYNEIYLTKNNNKLFELDDILKYKLNNFSEIHKNFELDDWIYAIQENNNIINIIKDQFNLKYFEKLIKFRISQGENLIMNCTICSYPKNKINLVFKNVFNKIQKSLNIIHNKMIDKAFNITFNTINLDYQWLTLKKKYFTWKGKWTNLDDFNELVKNKTIKYKIGNHYASSLYSPIIYNIFDISTYLPNFSKFDINELFLNKCDITYTQNKMIKFENDNYYLINCIKDTNEINTYSLINNFQELESSQETNKSLIYFSNNSFSAFKDIYLEIEKYINYFNKTYTSNYNKCVVNITDYYIKQLDTNSNKIYQDVCLIKVKGHLKGKFIFNKEKINFILQFPIINNINLKCPESLFDEKMNRPLKLLYTISIKNIKYIFKRRYYYKKSSLEIFTNENKSYYFYFKSQNDRDEVYKLINEIINVNSNNSLEKIIKDWEQWEISNFDLLMYLNNYSGRSYKDITQYPIFPWIISDYKIPKLKEFSQKTIRDLSKPIGALGDESRKENFMQKYQDNLQENINDDDNNDNNENNKNDTYFYNSHYSNPFYVCYYLNRIFPFSLCSIELQGGSFDKPERQFISLSSSYNNCMTESTDLRELIPEIFYLPELFINVNNINLGNNIIDKFEFPLWAKNSPYYCVVKNKIALESDYVSNNINNWIDLIFGYKQKGQLAIDSMNLFFNSSYEDNIDINQIINSNNKDDYEMYISKIDFGQTPSQLFNNKPFNQRVSRPNIKNKNIIFEKLNNLRFYNSTSENINLSTYNKCNKEFIQKMIVYVKAISNNKVLCIFNSGLCLLYKSNDSPFSESGLIFVNENQNKIYIPSDYKDKINMNNINNINEEDDDIMKVPENNQPILATKNGKIIFKGGYWDGKFLLFSLSSQKYIYYFIDRQSKVNSLITDNYNEEYLFVGTTSGKIFIYQININNKDLNKILTFNKVLDYHKASINYMFICNKLNIFSSVSSDKTCNIYLYPSMKMINSFKVQNDNDSFDYVFISSNPLPCIILYSQNNLYFYLYSINGHFIKKIQNKDKYLFSPKIICDNYHRDYLIFGTENSKIIIRKLPFLESSYEIDLNSPKDNMKFPIKCFDVSFDRKNIYYWKLDNVSLSVIRYKGDKKDDQTVPKVVNIFDGPLKI